MGKANCDIWEGRECRCGERNQNLVLCHHYKTLMADCLGQVGEVSLRSGCVGAMGSAGWLSVPNVMVRSMCFKLNWSLRSQLSRVGKSASFGIRTDLGEN